MNLCIYCRENAQGSGVAHVLPEGIIQNSGFLPSGIVCDSCNSYFGHELDATLLQSIDIAFPIQFHGLPGKRGTPRKQLAKIARQAQPEGKVSLQFSSVDHQVSVDDNGKRTVDIKVAPDPSFSLARFRRALHHVAFNAVALEKGGNYVSTSRFDMAREYIRRPKQHEVWSFAEGDIPGPRHIETRILKCDDQVIVMLDLIETRFIVSLLPNIDLIPIAAQYELKVVDESVTKPNVIGIRYVEK